MLKLGNTTINKTYLGSAEIKKIYLGNNLFYDVTTGIITSTPILSNFRIENANPDRVVFDATNDITGLTTQGFVIYNKTISSVTIDGDGLGGYFTVSSPFTFWDNNTIRLESGDGTVDDFYLDYIENQITQPSTSYSQEFYVTTTGSNGNSGLTEGAAFLTLTYALSQINTNNWIIHVKAGTYTGESIASSSNGYQGTITTGGIIQGYKTTPGDLNGSLLPFNYGEALNPAEYPVFDGGNRASTDFFEVYTDNYRIFRNFAVTNYRKGIYGDSNTARSGQVVENCIFKDLGDATTSGTGSSNGLAVSFKSNSNAVTDSRIKNCIGINITMEAFATAGNGNAMINCKAYCNEVSNDLSFATTDYYFLMNGSYNVQYNTYSYRDTQTGHYGHTNDLKGLVGACEYNLIKNCEAVNIYDCFGANFTTAKYNVFRNNISRADVANRPNSDVASAGLRWGNGASYNTWINHTAHDVDQGISIQYNGEDSLGEANIANNNLVINSLFYNLKSAIYINTTTGATSTLTNNRIEGCTFDTVTYLFNIVDNAPTLTVGTGNTFSGCILSNITNKDQLYSSSAWEYGDNAYYTLGFSHTIVSPSIEADPNYNGSYRPQNSSFIGYVRNALNIMDFEFKDREATTTYGYLKHANE